MGDVEHGEALPLEIGHDLEEHLRLVGRERAGGLVQNQEARVLRQRLGDFHLLLLGDVDVAHQRGGIHVLQAHLIQQRAAVGVELLPVDQAEPALGLARLEDVLRHGQRVGQGQLLVDHGDSQRAGLDGRVGRNLLAVEDDLAGGGLVHAGEYVHQRGLARAVFAHDGVDLALAHVKVHIVERLYAGEFLANMGNTANYLFAHRSFLPIVLRLYRRTRSASACIGGGARPPLDVSSEISEDSTRRRCRG